MNCSVRVKRKAYKQMMKGLQINPVVLIIINVLAPSMYILISGMYLEIFLLVFACLVILLMGEYKKLFGLLITFTVLIGTYYFTINNEKTSSVAMFFLILSQSVPCLFLAASLISRYTSAQLLSALETLRIPRVMVVATTITLKYIPTFVREFKLLRDSMRLRGINFTLRRPIQSFRYFVVPQLFRCSALADEVTAAGIVKGIDVPKRRSSYYEQKIRWFDYAILAFFVAGLGGCYLWTKMR